MIEEGCLGNAEEAGGFVGVAALLPEMLLSQYLQKFLKAPIKGVRYIPITLVVDEQSPSSNLLVHLGQKQTILINHCVVTKCLLPLSSVSWHFAKTPSLYQG